MRAVEIKDLIQVETPEGTQDAVEEAANHDSPTTAGRGVGRPSKYNDALASEICRLLSEGESLRQICGRKDMPARSTVNSSEPLTCAPRLPHS